MIFGTIYKQADEKESVAGGVVVGGKVWYDYRTSLG